MTRDEPTSERWTLRELGQQVEAALSVDYRGPQSGQVRAVPDARTIRYYTTLGLVDRPVEMRGRTALYDRRHLLQVVAIKRLQEQGKSLADVQEALAGVGRAELAEIARLPDDAAPRPRRKAARADFWRSEPAPVAAPAPAPAETPPAHEPRALVELELAPGVRLQIEADRLPRPRDAEILHNAAASLVDTVRRLGLASDR